MKNLKLLTAASLALGLSLQGCVFDESGTEYKEPSANTEPVINLNYDSQLPLNTWRIFATACVRQHGDVPEALALCGGFGNGQKLDLETLKE